MLIKMFGLQIKLYRTADGLVKNKIRHLDMRLSGLQVKLTI